MAKRNNTMTDNPMQGITIDKFVKKATEVYNNDKLELMKIDEEIGHKMLMVLMENYRKALANPFTERVTLTRLCDFRIKYVQVGIFILNSISKIRYLRSYQEKLKESEELLPTDLSPFCNRPKGSQRTVQEHYEDLEISVQNAMKQIKQYWFIKKRFAERYRASRKFKRLTEYRKMVIAKKVAEGIEINSNQADIEKMLTKKERIKTRFSYFGRKHKVWNIDEDILPEKID
jgi:hypothetical protein